MTHDQKLNNIEGSSSPQDNDTSAQNDDLVGSIFAQRYEIEKRIGQGGMGVVYLAKHRSLGRKVVIKTLLSAVTDEGKKRFEREARQLSSLSHANIVTLYDFGYEDQTSYIVMEYVEGNTLTEVIQQSPKMGRKEFFSTAIQIADAVGEAHRHGVIHRDLKPANIMLTQRPGDSSLVKVLDFGLAKLNHSDIELTKEGNLVGSVSYVPPEHILGNGTDTRGDVYALGVVFYYMLAGQKPFKGKDEMTVLYQHVHNEPPALADLLDADQGIPQSTVDLIHQCLSKDPDERPAHAGHLLERLLDEISLSTLTMPISSRDMARLAQLKASEDGMFVLGEDSRDSGLLIDEHLHTPTHLTTQGDVSALHLSRLGEASSVTNSQILENSAILQMQVRRTRWLMAMVLLLALGGGIGIWVFDDDPDEHTQEQSRRSLERLESRLDEVEAQIGEQEYGSAEMILDGIKAELVDHPDLLDRAAKYRDRIRIERLLRSAERHVGKEDWQDARAAYEQVLDIDPDDVRAQDALEKLPAEDRAIEPAEPGAVEIASSPPAEVFIDDALVGTTPLSKKLSSGTHVVELRANGYQTWRETVSVEEGSRLMLRPNLTAEEEPSAPRRSRRPRRVQANPKPKPSVAPSSEPSPSDPPSVKRPAKKAATASPKRSGSPFEPSRAGEAAKSGSGDDLFGADKGSPKANTFDLADEDSSSSGSTNADFLD